MLKFYKLRITTQDEKAIEAFLSRYISNYLWSIEKVGTAKQHAHFYLETTTKEPTIRAHIRKKFGDGNKNYSLTACEQYPLEHCAYVLKEGNYKHTFDEEFIHRCVEYDEDMKEQIKKRKKEKRTRLTNIQQFEADLDPPILQNEEDGYTHGGRWLTEDYIVQLLVLWYKRTGKRVNPHQIATEAYTLSLKYVNSYEAQLQSKILSLMQIR